MVMVNLLVCLQGILKKKGGGVKFSVFQDNLWENVAIHLFLSSPIFYPVYVRIFIIITGKTTQIFITVKNIEIWSLCLTDEENKQHVRIKLIK